MTRRGPDTARLDGLRRHLIATRLAGEVQTSPADTLHNCLRLRQGDPDVTFGLSDWRDATVGEAAEAVRSLCGGRLPIPNDRGEVGAPRGSGWESEAGGSERGSGWESEAGRSEPSLGRKPEAAESLDGPGYIDPEATLAAIMRHRDRLAALGAGGGRVLIATGHPTGLLPHYQALARALQDAGSTLLAPIEERELVRGADGRSRALRYLDGVGCLSDGASLRHTHRSRFMEAALDALGGGPGAVDLVIADHGFAGAAIERGLATLSIADLNDVGLPLAQARGRTDAVLPIDDNLPPRVFVPVTAAMLAW